MYYEKLFAGLQSKQVKYLVVGGLAVNLYGVPRMTADVDIALSFDPENVRALLQVLEDLGFQPTVPVEPETLADPDRRSAWQSEKPMRAFPFANRDNPPQELDVLLAIPFDFEEAYARRRVIAAGSLKIPLPSVDDLILTKRETGRKQDEADIAALELVKEQMSEESDGARG